MAAGEGPTAADRASAMPLRRVSSLMSTASVLLPGADPHWAAARRTRYPTRFRPADPHIS